MLFYMHKVDLSIFLFCVELKVKVAVTVKVKITKIRIVHYSRFWIPVFMPCPQ